MAEQFERTDLKRIADALTSGELKALLQLRSDGRGNYDPGLTRARNSLERKGLADSAMTLGFGSGRFSKLACVQSPTPLGEAVQDFIRAL
jgi:hypothetical protein